MVQRRRSIISVMPRPPLFSTAGTKRVSHFRRVLVLLGVFAAGWNFGRKTPLPGAGNLCLPAQAYSAATISAAPSADRALDILSYVVKPGDTFSRIFSRFGLPGATAAELSRRLRPLGCRALFPGDSMVLTVCEDGGLKELSLLSRWKWWYHVRKAAQAVHTEKRPVRLTSCRCLLRGTLTTSLFAEMSRLGEGAQLGVQMTDIFAWDINFFLDPRKGDTFEVLFEKSYAEGRFAGYGDILAARYSNGERTWYAFLHEDREGRAGYFDEHGRSMQKTFLRAPLRYTRVSSGYSYSRRHPILGIYRPHLGIDYAAPCGTPVVAAADGTVVFAGWMGDYGKHIRIAHGGSYKTYYGHLQSIAPGIRPGAAVTQGRRIGRVGATGLATGPHLDYRMKIGSRFIDPEGINLPAKSRVAGDDMERFVRRRDTRLILFATRFGGMNGSFTLTVPEPVQTGAPPMFVSEEPGDHDAGERS